MLRAHPPEGTYLVWIDFSALQKKEATIHKQLVREAGVVLLPGSECCENDKSFFRMNVACPKEILLNGLERMADSLV
jgi:cysteine-S-conjugate beta-lyase